MLKDLFRHSVVYGVGNVFMNATGFFLLPLYTSYLTISEYGILEVFVVSITILLRLFQLGFGSGLFKYYSFSNDSNSKDYHNKILVSSSFYFIIIFSAISISFMFIFRTKFSYLLFDTSVYAPLFGIMLLSVFLGIFPVIPKAQLRAENKSFVFSILSFISFLFQIGLAIVFVAILHMKVEGVLAARVGAATASAFLFIFVIRKRLMFRFSLKKIKDMLSYSVYLVPVSIGSLILIMSNRYFILLFRGSEELGIFSVGNKIASVVLLGVTAFQLAWPSIMFRLKKLPNAKVYYSKVFTYYILVFSYFVLVLSLFSKEFILLLTNEGYSSAVLIIPIISSGYFFYGLFYSGIVGITIFKKTYFQTIAMGVGALVCVLLTYLLTPTYGIIGAAIALAVSFAVLAFLGIYFSQRIYSFGIEVNRLLKVIIVFSLIMLLNLYGGLHDVSLSMILLKLFILVALYPLFLYLFNFFTQEEVTIIFSRIRNIRLNRRRRSNSQ